MTSQSLKSGSNNRVAPGMQRQLVFADDFCCKPLFNAYVCAKHHMVAESCTKRDSPYGLTRVTLPVPLRKLQIASSNLFSYSPCPRNLFATLGSPTPRSLNLHPIPRQDRDLTEVHSTATLDHLRDLSQPFRHHRRPQYQPSCD